MNDVLIIKVYILFRYLSHIYMDELIVPKLLISYTCICNEYRYQIDCFK